MLAIALLMVIFQINAQSPCPPCNNPPITMTVAEPVSGGTFAVTYKDCGGVFTIISAVYTGPGFGAGPLYLANLLQAIFDANPSLGMIQIPASCYKWTPGGGGSENPPSMGTANLTYCAAGCCLFSRGGGGIITNENEPGYAIRCSLNESDFDCFNLCDQP